ncbi:ROP1 ENHANCER 1 [Hibiscus trionum]|uniref:ROP1 ENHANCER 1 n=1 Tax=Hibiscus trionum TaxID=183268 RepID=A0A9W7I9F8_HIBTR|nr:ROP1 ENHANCER 1 [Hibiscus trionum]
MATKKEDSCKTQLKMASRKEEPPQAQQKMSGKKEEPSQAQQKTATKKEDSSQAQLKMEESPHAQSGDAATAAATPGPASAATASSPPMIDYLLKFFSYIVRIPEFLKLAFFKIVKVSAFQGLKLSQVLKSGSLFLSSKGIGWTSWKKRWFILTPTSLVFFRSDPNASSQKGNEVNLTLGGIDLNNSGSVVVKADKKLITVQFQDGRDGRTFTLKAETSEDLYEWKTALEKALSQAPSSVQSGGQNGVFGNDQADAVDGSKEPVNDKQPVRSAVLHRPILLALEDVDGSPTFLEKALRFVEEYGVKVEGILRQAADVEDVERRIREYEQGKTEFSQDEDAHVIADCVKYVIRELPSSPVPASCCSALLEACRTEHSARVNATRMAVLDTFPEPNRRLLQRILMMMQTVASHKNVNLMSSSAVAACMAPLLLRPLLSGECEIESNFDVGGDGSLQLLQAAAAANHAQAIVITLLEQYDKIFGEGCVSPDLYSDSEESGSESEEEADDDDESYEDDECEDESQGSDDDNDSAESGTGSENGHSKSGDDKDSESSSSSSKSSKTSDDDKATKKVSSTLNVNDSSKKSEDNRRSKTSKPAELSKGVHGVTKLEDTSTRHSPVSSAAKPPPVGNGPGHNARHSTVLGRSSGSKKLSTDSVDLPCEEEVAVESLEAEKSELQKRLTEEIEGNTVLEASLEKRKKALHEQRLALEKEVARLEVELQRAREKRIALEAGLNPSQGSTSLPDKLDEKTKADLEDITQSEADINNLNKKVDDLGKQINKQPEQESASMSDSCNQREPNHQSKTKDKTKGSEAACTRSRSKKMNVDKAEPETVSNKRYTKSNSKKSAMKGEKMNVDKAESEKGKKHESPSAEHDSKSTSAAETVSNKRYTKSNSKKSATKGEEPRSQTANEKSGMEKGRGSSQAVPPSSSDKGKGAEPIKSIKPTKSVKNPDKGKGAEPPTKSVKNPEKGRGPDVSE